MEFSTHWRTKVTKDKLIECWSEYRKEPDSKFYNIASLSRAYSKVFKNITKATVSESWKGYILRTNGYKYCTKCKNLCNLKAFATCNTHASTVQSKCKECDSVYRKEHKDYYLAKCNERQAAKLKRTPSWLTEDDIWMMQETYSLAKLREECTGIKWHVDHIIPLQGKLVSGLHTPHNLQVITAVSNLTKSNKYAVE